MNILGLFAAIDEAFPEVKESSLHDGELRFKLGGLVYSVTYDERVSAPAGQILSAMAKFVFAYRKANPWHRYEQFWQGCWDANRKM